MIGHPTRRITQGASIDKGWEAKHGNNRFPDAFMHIYIYLLLLLLLLLLKSNPSRQHAKVLYHWGGQEKKKDRKSQKSRS